MPAPPFLAGLPKPVLFALYGALGGLLGALALGEPLWALLRPPPPQVVVPPPAPPQLALAVSPQVALYPGTENEFAVLVARDGFDGPVTVRFAAAPGVEAAAVVVPAGQTRATAKLVARAGAGTGTVKLEATATAPGAPPARAPLEAVVTAPPPDAPRLAVSMSPRVQVYQRGKNRFAVQIARGGFDGDVRVEFDDLPADVTAAPFTLPAGTTEAEAELRAGPGAPLGPARVRVSARALVPQRVPQPLEVVARGGAALEVLVAPRAAVDIVFAFDISGSMQWAIDGTTKGVQKFADALAKNQLDARVGLVGFRDTTLGQKNVILKFDGEPLTKDFAKFRAEVGKLRAGGGGAAGESSLDGIADAADYEFRGQVHRVIVLVTDEEPKNPDGRMAGVMETAAYLKQKGIDQLHVVTLPGLFASFGPLRAGAPGNTFDLREVNRAADGFDKLLPELGRAIADLVAERPAGKLDLPAAPPPPALGAADARLALAPAREAAPPVLAPAVRGVQSTGAYDATKKGRLVLAVGAWTGAVAALVCLALVAGQGLYLQGRFPAARAALVAVGGGLLAGLIGGAAGQGLYLLAAEAALFRVLGWALLGALAGAGLALVVPNLKPALGAAGGALGGTVGGLAFLAVSAVSAETAGRLAGGLMLGACIGLMLALVERAARAAWLEVRYGPREAITVNLGPEPVKVGGDAKLCTVWARGAAPVALRFFVRDGRVICEDAVTRTEGAVADGARRTAGAVTVTVRTGSGAPAGPVPPVSKRAAATDDDDLLPMDSAPAVAPTTPNAPVPPAGKPNIARTATGGCPGCGRAIPGDPGRRYCMLCDATF